MDFLNKYFSLSTFILLILGIFGIIIGNNIFLLVLIVLYSFYFLGVGDKNILGSIVVRIFLGFYLVVLMGVGLLIGLGGFMLFAYTIFKLVKGN